MSWSQPAARVVGGADYFPLAPGQDPVRLYQRQTPRLYRRRFRICCGQGHCRRARIMYAQGTLGGKVYLQQRIQDHLRDPGPVRGSLGCCAARPAHSVPHNARLLGGGELLPEPVSPGLSPAFHPRRHPPVLRKRLHADTGKARRELGYQPTSIRAAVHEAYAFHYHERKVITNPEALRPRPNGAGQNSIRGQN